MNIVQLAVGEAPENVLDRVASPTEVGGIPTEEVPGPVGEELPVLRIARAPAARDGVALEVHVDTASPRFLE